VGGGSVFRHDASDAAATPRLLIADDSPIVCAVISAQLEGQFTIVGTAVDADGALELARRHQPDVALIDVHMFGGGLQATQAISNVSQATAVVILAADEPRSSALQYLDAGAIAGLRKGIAAHHLADRLNSALATPTTVVERVVRLRRVAEDRFHAAFEQAGIGMAIFPLEGEAAGRVVSANAAYAQMLGRERDELVGHNVANWTRPEDLHESSEDPIGMLASGEADRVQFEQRYLHHDGHVIWTLVTAASFSDEGGRRAAIIQVLDVSERKHIEGQLQHLADHDPLTGLYNRRRFEEELDRELRRGRRYGGGLAVLGVDLDGFKFVNDSLGHSAGNELVARLANVIKDSVRATDIVARTGGDEFAILLPEGDERMATLVADKLLRAIARSGKMLRGNRHAQVTSSIGITTIRPGEESTAEDLIVEADIAMYEAKAAGKNRSSAYHRDEQRRELMVARQDWMMRLRQAVEEEQFVLYAQPIVGICSHGVPRFELLLRLPDGHGDLIPPGTFLYNAERFDLIQSIDRWVMSQAVQLLYEYRSRGIGIALSINISAKTLNQGDIAEHLSKLLEHYPIAEGSLVVELTEAAAIANAERTRELARRLRQLGARLALDDFGAGFATFYYLKHLDFDYIKIDGEFIKALPSTPVDQLVVKAVVDIARGLRADTIAEFVQDDETLELLRDLGVGYSQGYHTGRPGPLQTALPPLLTRTT
jgi:diguanylate cyclase (GGDEF)-like protein/PAS domain S-box-containing protein